MPDTIYDELAWRTGWFSITDNTGTWWGRADDKSVRLTEHPFATIDAIDAEFRRRGWGWFKDTFDVLAVMPGNPTEVLSRTDDTRHDLATLLLRCVQQSEKGAPA